MFDGGGIPVHGLWAAFAGDGIPFQTYAVAGFHIHSVMTIWRFPSTTWVMHNLFMGPPFTRGFGRRSLS